MTQHRSITARMADALLYCIEHKGRVNESEDWRTSNALVRRGLLHSVEEGQRRLRITLEGRETLARHYNKTKPQRWRAKVRELLDPSKADELLEHLTDTLVQPNVVHECIYWQDFYGLHCRMWFLDDPKGPVQLDYSEEYPTPYQQLRRVLHDITRNRGFLVACCPEHHNPDLETPA